MKRCSLYLSLLLIATLLMALLTSCGNVNLDRAEKRLTEAGYTVTRAGEGAPEHLVDKVDKDVEANMKATKTGSGEWVTLIRFQEKDTAKTFYELQKKSYGDKYFMTVLLEGRTVIYGWSTAVEIAK